MLSCDHRIELAVKDFQNYFTVKCVGWILLVLERAFILVVAQETRRIWCSFHIFWTAFIKRCYLVQNRYLQTAINSIN